MAVAWLETQPPTIRVAYYGAKGTPTGFVDVPSVGSPCVDWSGPVVAALPSGKYALAYTALSDGDGTGIGLPVGTYEASLFVHTAPGAKPYSNSNTAALRIVRTRDEVVVAEHAITPTVSWVRESLTFEAAASETYRLEIAPSVQAAPIAQSLDIALLAAAAQVIPIATTDAGTTPPGAWERTDGTRTVPGGACGDPDGTALRRQFKRRCEYVCRDGLKRNCSAQDTDARPVNCFYEATFGLGLDDIESGRVIPSGQIAIGNFNFRHNLAGINVVGTGVTDCSNDPSPSCNANGFVEYQLQHSGDVQIRNWEGGTLPAHMNGALIEHAKALATERVITNPPSTSDLGLLDPYMKGELEGRPIEGAYVLRIYDTPTLRWERVKDLQLVWRYHGGPPTRLPCLHGGARRELEASGLDVKDASA